MSTAGWRKTRSSAQHTVKLVALVSEDLDRQVRALAAKRGIGVATLVREWIIEKLRDTGKPVRPKMLPDDEVEAFWAEVEQILTTRHRQETCPIRVSHRLVTCPPLDLVFYYPDGRRVHVRCGEPI